MQKKLILLNGPIGCGKTDLTYHIKDILGVCYVEDSRCKDRLFQLTQQFFDISEREFWNIYEDRGAKELPNELFRVRYAAAERLSHVLGESNALMMSGAVIIDGLMVFNLSIRQAMIYVSEIICKPTFGSDYFGVYRANKVADSFSPIHVDDSCFGTMDEITPVIDKIGIENVLLVRIHGRGSFDGDSRQYLEDEDIPAGLKAIDVYNDGELDVYLDDTFSNIEQWIKGEL